MRRRRRRGPFIRRVATTRRRGGRGQTDRGLVRAQRRTLRRDEVAQRRRMAARYRRLGGRRGQARRHAARTLFEPRLDVWELSSGVLEAAYPWQVASQAGDRGSGGMVIGPSATGGTFTFDPWTLYEQGRLSNPNLLIVGEIGSGKSALAKALVWRGLEFGRGAHVIDPKGEYGPLADAAGIEAIRLHPGGTVTLNPLDPGVAGHALSPGGLFHRNLATVRALLEATLSRGLRQLELVVVSAALATVAGVDPASQPAARHVVGRGRPATLTMVADALTDPPARVAARTNMDHTRVVDESRELALAAARLVDATGDLGGMFAGHTNLDADPTAPLTVIDIAPVYRTHRAALPLVMIATAAWLQLATDTTPAGRFQVNDEGWALLSDEAAARWMQTNQKLSRQLGLSVINVLHRLSDTAAAGPAGSTTRALAEGVIADTGTWIVYRQKPSEQALLADTLGLNRLQTGLVCRLGRGRGLWISAGERRQVALVDHLISEVEQRLVDTDATVRAANRPDQPQQPERAGEAGK